MKKISETKPEKIAGPYGPRCGESWAEYRARKMDENKSAGKTAEEEAADRIVRILGMDADTIEDETDPQSKNTETQELAPTCGMQIEELTPGQMLANSMQRLRLYNAMIDILNAAQEDDEICTAKLNVQMNEMEQRMRRLRMQVFEPMIEWDKMAQGKKEDV